MGTTVPNRRRKLEGVALPSTKPLVMHGQRIRLPVRREEDVRFLTVEGTGP